MNWYSQSSPWPERPESETAGAPTRKPDCIKAGQAAIAAATLIFAWFDWSGSLKPSTCVDFCLLLMLEVPLPPPHIIGRNSRSGVEAAALPQSYHHNGSVMVLAPSPPP